MKIKKIEFRIAPSWHIIEKIRNKIDKELRAKLPEFVESVTICASELCENAIKYGVPVPHLQEIEFNLEVKKGIIQIKISNGIKEAKDFNNVTRTIDLINRSRSTEELYVNRLRELMENPKPGESQLGLFRIAYETNFQLRYEHLEDMLIVIAEKKI